MFHRYNGDIGDVVVGRIIEVSEGGIHVLHQLVICIWLCY